MNLTKKNSIDRLFNASGRPNLGGDLRRHGDYLLHSELEAVQGEIDEEDGSENFEMGVEMGEKTLRSMLGLRKAGELAATDWWSS